MDSRIPIVVIILALAAPAAAAWAGKGQAEPDTWFDRDGSFMWSDTDTTQGARGTRVYFNAFSVQNGGYGAHGITTNPNVAALGTQRQGWPGQMAAFLGVWKDCNGDGYVGYGEHGLWEYRTTLLLNDFSVCPVVDAGPVPSGAASHNYVTTHNDGTWVREFLPLGPDERASFHPDINPFDLNDNEARVWADWNAPGDLPPGTRCSVVFVPAGTYSTTGGMLAYADCLGDFTVTDGWNAAVATVGGDGLGAGQLSFQDKPRDQSNSTSQLNRPNPWGRPSDASAVTTFDCSSPQTVPARKVPGTQHSVGVSRVGVPTTNSGGSIAGTLNETATGMDDCDRANNDGQWEHAPAAAPYGMEDAGIRNNAGDKDMSDFPMSYSEGQRPAGLLTPSQLGRGASRDAGTRVYDSEGLWISGTRILEDRNPFVGRASVRGNAFMPVQYVTAYAFVGADAVSKYSLKLNANDVVGTYGSDNCGTSIGVGQPARNGWLCDPSLWSHACAQAYTCLGSIGGNPTVDISVQPGKPYQLRDVDCYDASASALRDEGVSWGTLTGTSCV